MKGAWAANVASKGLWCKGIGKGKGKCKGQKWDAQEEEEGDQTLPCKVKGKGKCNGECTSQKWDIQEDEDGEATMACVVKGTGKGKDKGKGKCKGKCKGKGMGKGKCQGLQWAAQEREECEETVPCEVKGKGKDMGKGKCKGKGKYCGSKSFGGAEACSGGAAAEHLAKKACQRRACAAGCGFQVTWHPTHCCGACARGGSHGPRCEKEPVPPAPIETTPNDGVTGECMATDTEGFLLLSAAEAADMHESVGEI